MSYYIDKVRPLKGLLYLYNLVMYTISLFYLLNVLTSNLTLYHSPLLHYKVVIRFIYKITHINFTTHILYTFSLIF